MLLEAVGAHQLWLQACGYHGTSKEREKSRHIKLIPTPFNYNLTSIYAVPVDELTGSVTGIGVADAVDDAPPPDPPPEEGFWTTA